MRIGLFVKRLNKLLVAVTFLFVYPCSKAFSLLRPILPYERMIISLNVPPGLFNLCLQSLYIIFVFQHLFTIVMAVSFMSSRSIHAEGSGVLRGHKQIMIDDNEIRVISD